MYKIDLLKTAYEAQADSSKSIAMQAYMKNNFAFFGIKAPDRRAIDKAFFKQYGSPTYAELPDLVRGLYAEPQRELHYFAMELVAKHKKNWQPDLLPLLEFMLVTNSWWDSVDFIAGTLVGDFFKKYPELMLTKTANWNDSTNFWLVRSSIIFQLKYKKNTDTDLLFTYILPHCYSKEFFIQKAIGWALREYSKTDALQIKGFVEATPELPALSKREALRLMKNI